MKNKLVDKGKYLLEKSNFSNLKNSKLGIGFRKIVRKINNLLDKRVGNYTYRTITCCSLIVIGLIMILVMAFGGKEKVLNYPILFVNEEEELMIYGKGSKEATKIANLDDIRLTKQGASVIIKSQTRKRKKYITNHFL